MSKPHSLPPEDQGLWNAFRSGDEDAFGEIARKYYIGLFSYGVRFSQDREFIKDCIQDLFFELWTRRQTLGDTDFVKFYLLKSLRRKIYRESTRQNRIFQETDLDDITENVGEDSIEQQLIAVESSQEKTRLINELLETLPRRQQEVIHLKFYQELGNEAIAQIMSISKQAVANLIYRSIRELKERM
jgi:RNA polymerase sigma factor (sigma-70 family)